MGNEKPTNREWLQLPGQKRGATRNLCHDIYDQSNLVNVGATIGETNNDMPLLPKGYVLAADV
ncbi:hypothetical protein W01_08520 [Candidatus Nitrotoga sp. AM1P]|nr:hypothetical protein W01_08520 [Candidatus Nitrotoga sp. AM1P]